MRRRRTLCLSEHFVGVEQVEGLSITFVNFTVPFLSR